MLEIQDRGGKTTVLVKLGDTILAQGRELIQYAAMPESFDAEQGAESGSRIWPLTSAAAHRGLQTRPIGSELGARNTNKLRGGRAGSAAVRGC
jgi:hypothetical protein